MEKEREDVQGEEASKDVKAGRSIYYLIFMLALFGVMVYFILSSILT